jgi:hypothetical protein
VEEGSHVGEFRGELGRHLGAHPVRDQVGVEPDPSRPAARAAGGDQVPAVGAIDPDLRGPTVADRDPPVRRANGGTHLVEPVLPWPHRARARIHFTSGALTKQ